MTEIKKRVASMETSLDKLAQQETEYTDELDAALTQYAELQQSADADSTELDTARLAIRPDKERDAIQRLQIVYGKGLDSRMRAQIWENIAEILNEPAEPGSIRQKLQQSQMQQNKQSYKKTWPGAVTLLACNCIINEFLAQVHQILL